MNKKYVIEGLHAREVLDSRGNPTVEVKAVVNGFMGVAKAPSGASTGKYEAVELRDDYEKRYDGKGVLKAVNNVNTTINEKILYKSFSNLEEIDNFLIEIDGTKNKGKLGANATIATSIAISRAIASLHGLELYEYLGGVFGNVLPVPMMNILNGGAHADNTVDIQEFMIMPVGAPNFKEAVRMCAEVYHELKRILKERNLSTGVGDEGGFAPNLEKDEEAFDLIIEAIKGAGFVLREDFVLAIDAASSEWYKDGKYIMPKKNIEYSKDELINYWEELLEKYPIYSMEDIFSEDDWESFSKFTERNSHRVQIVGDDLFVTNFEKLTKGIEEKAANSILIKPNQIGTMTETLDVIKLAKQNGFTCVISHRSGETSDTTIADIAVGLNSMQIKTGAPTRSDRTEKYNRLMEIEEALGDSAKYAGFDCFKFKENN